MGDAFIVRRGSSGGAPFAAISVTYPSGSTCTCSNGVKTLTAKGTGGSYIFYVPEAGTWTVSCTDGTKTATQTVVIDSQYQSESISLAYLLYLIKNGVSQVPEIKTRVTTSTVSGSLRIMQTEGVHCYLHLGKITIPQGAYSTLKITFPANTPVLSFPDWGLGFGLSDTITAPTSYSASVYDATKRLGETSTYAGTTQSLAIGNISGQYYTAIDFEGNAGATEGIYVKNMWLE